jgi:hypothetical protein
MTVYQITWNHDFSRCNSNGCGERETCKRWLAGQQASDAYVPWADFSAMIEAGKPCDYRIPALQIK